MSSTAVLAQQLTDDGLKAAGAFIGGGLALAGGRSARRTATRRPAPP